MSYILCLENCHDVQYKYCVGVSASLVVNPQVLISNLMKWSLLPTKRPLGPSAMRETPYTQFALFTFFGVKSLLISIDGVLMTHPVTSLR